MDDQGRYASGDYLRQNPTWHVEDSAWKAAHVLDIIERNGIRPKRVCEVGCGAGEVLAQLHRRMPGDVVFTGWEVSPQAHEMCLTRQADRLTYRLGDFLAADEPCDLLLLMDVIEHMGDYRGFLRKAHGRADRIVLHVPLDLSSLAVAQIVRIRNPHDLLGHIHFFTKETLLDALADCGLTVVDCFFTDSAGQYPTPPSIQARLLRLAQRVLRRVNMDVAVRLLGGMSLMVLAE